MSFYGVTFFFGVLAGIYWKYVGIALVVFALSFLIYGLPRPILVAGILLPFSLGEIVFDAALHWVEIE